MEGKDGGQISIHLNSDIDSVVGDQRTVISQELVRNAEVSFKPTEENLGLTRFPRVCVQVKVSES